MTQHKHSLIDLIMMLQSLLFCFLLEINLVIYAFNIPYSISHQLKSSSNHPSSYKKLFFTPSSDEVSVIYQPMLDSNTAMQMAIILITTVIATSIWWYQVIPTQRAAVAKSKRRGDIQTYLQTLKTAESGGEKKLERWFFADWLNKKNKDAAIPLFGKEKWNSGDNPVLVAFGAIMACVITASIAERSITIFH